MSGTRGRVSSHLDGRRGPVLDPRRAVTSVSHRENANKEWQEEQMKDTQATETRRAGKSKPGKLGARFRSVRSRQLGTWKQDRVLFRCFWDANKSYSTEGLMVPFMTHCILPTVHPGMQTRCIISETMKA